MAPERTALWARWVRWLGARRDDLEDALLCGVVAWGVMAVQEVLLFARPAPTGHAFVSDWWRYFFYAPLYNGLATMPVALVFAALIGVLPPLGRKGRPLALGIELLLLAAVVALDQIDAELRRFMGVPLSWELIATYGDVTGWNADIGGAIWMDGGGPGSAVMILVGGVTLMLAAGARVVARPRPRPLPNAMVRFGLPALVLVALVAPARVYGSAKRPTGDFRDQRTRPAVMALWMELSAAARLTARPSDLDALVLAFQARWLASSRDKAWIFPDPEYPFFRVPADREQHTPLHRLNVVYLQLETMRGWDQGFLNPERRPGATPFLDGLVARPNSAYFTRAMSYGPPTISGFIAAHGSLAPHSHRDIATRFTTLPVVTIPGLLKGAGYRRAFFTGSDPDWDNETVWLRKWYDETHLVGPKERDDRLVFRAALARMRELGRSGQPFFMGIASISNHYPFRSVDPVFDVTEGRNHSARVLNTTRFTDAALQEFFESAAREPWYEQTLFVIAGDHGYNLGEHAAPSLRSGFREALWVPLIFHGAVGALAAGRHDGPASLLDVAPTLAEALGLRVPNAWMGHSLLAGTTEERVVLGARDGFAFAESHDLSVVDQDGYGLHAFAPSDVTQARELLATGSPALTTRATQLSQDAKDLARLTNAVLARNKLMPSQLLGASGVLEASR